MSGLALRLAPSSASWLEQAACRGRDTSWWFATPGSWETAVATSVCHSCPVRLQCLADALEQETDSGAAFGVRGGVSAQRREAMLGHRRAVI